MSRFFLAVIERMLICYSSVAVSLPGNNVVGGFWPGIWTFGNLGRAGYTGTTDGVGFGAAVVLCRRC